MESVREAGMYDLRGSRCRGTTPQPIRARGMCSFNNMAIAVKKVRPKASGR